MSTSKPVSLTLTVSTDNECTSYPWWVIVDPRQNMDLSIDMAAFSITGPFFSREEAEETLRRTRYNYSKRAVVYCKSGCYTEQYQAAWRKANMTLWQRLKEAFNAYR